MKQVSNFTERFKEAFGDRSVTEFAVEIGVSKQTVSAYLNGVRKPKSIVSGEIARKLNVSPAWLLGFDVPKEPSDMNHNSQDHRTVEFIKIFQKLTPEQQDLILKQIKGILSE
jgi:transcriptional regulator with XRE-family HTH domain